MNRRDTILLSALVLLTSISCCTVIARAQASLPGKPMGDMSTSELTKRADAGDPAAQNELGVRYGLGFDVPKDPERAIEWFKKAASQGYGKARFNLAAAYFNDAGARENQSVAFQWFLLAEEVGDPNGKDGVSRMQSEMSARDRNAAYILVGDRYQNGTDVKQDYGRAMQWYRKGADGGDGAACERIASLYALGRGVPQDNSEILHWLQRGAELGDPLAAYDLGRAYEKGAAVPQDGGKAVKLYEQSAAYNNRKSLFALGNLYLDGKVVPQNQEKALMWFLLAARYGDSAAGEKAAKLSAQLPPKQVEKAKQDAKRYVSLQKQPLALTQK